MPPDAPLAFHRRADLVSPSWRDPVLIGTFLIVALVAGFQVTITLLRPPWLGPVSAWLIAVLAWLELLLMVLFSRWTSRTHQPGAPSVWLLSVALCRFALAQTFWLIGHEFLFSGSAPVPWWSDLFFLLQFPCFFLAILLLPLAPHRGPQGLMRLRMFLDSLLLMGAVTILF